MQTCEGTLGKISQVLSVVIGATMVCALSLAGMSYGRKAVAWYHDFCKPKPLASQPWMQVAPLVIEPIDWSQFQCRPTISEVQMDEINGIMAQNTANNAIRQAQQADHISRYRFRP